ncbi:uncharacterized protein UV8b_03389 [Ustilaginoidea virens]|uniref:Uncharacterized protein n=1 Tax=Ustilaginoidea virens TaxID=1159556 RepID=A0A8E5HPS7_USTVR|nr:uncharacterized protein UV8b_03389 [Ustilaginoidea virens]QUC19148.1 hypothetical protein UV8b_03389 [Ustilaginoidea virens]
MSQKAASLQDARHVSETGKTRGPGLHSSGTTFRKVGAQQQQPIRACFSGAGYEFHHPMLIHLQLLATCVLPTPASRDTSQQHGQHGQPDATPLRPDTQNNNQRPGKGVGRRAGTGESAR